MQQTCCSLWRTTWDDCERIRTDAVQHGRLTVALKATSEARALSKIRFTDLRLDSTTAAEWLRGREAITRGIYRWIREQPGAATVPAQYVEDIDPRVTYGKPSPATA